MLLESWKRIWKEVPALQELEKLYSLEHELDDRSEDAIVVYE